MPDTTASAPASRTRLVLIAAAVVVLGVVLALTQPWLAFVDEVASDSLPAIAGTPDVMSSEPSMVPTPMVEPSPDPPMAPEPEPDQMSEPTDPEPTGPIVLASGSFISRDHETTGDVAIVQLEDGRRVLTIEALSTSNGPDLFVYLDDDPADAEALAFDDGLDLGPLRGNVGDLVYEIPPETDLTDLDTVVIWCDRFSHVFGAADLLPA